MTVAETQRRQAPQRSVQALRGADFEPFLPAAVNIPEDPPLRLDDWVRLNADDGVIVRTPDGYTRAGLVDAVTNDASVFWLWLDGGGGRTAVLEEEGCHVWLTSSDPIRSCSQEHNR